MYHRAHDHKKRFRKKRPAYKHKHHKKKYGVGQTRLKRRNLQGVVETKFLEGSVNRDPIIYTDYTASSLPTGARAPATYIPDGAQLYLPTAWTVGVNQGVDCNEVVGCSLNDRFISLKMRMDFNIENTSPTTAYPARIRYIQGWCKHTMADWDFNTDALEHDDYEVKVGTMLVNNKLGKDFLEYGHTWRNIEVLKQGTIRVPDKMRNPQPISTPFVSPPWTEEFKWSPKRKQLLHKQYDFGEFEKNLQRFRSWIPFVCIFSPSFVCPNINPAVEPPFGLPANYAPVQATMPVVTTTSKVWYADS